MMITEKYLQSKGCTKKRIGKVIKTRRLEMGFTQIQIAEKVGICGSSFSQLERGEYFPRLDNFVAILDVLRIDLIFIAFENDIESILDGESISGIRSSEK